MNRRTDNVNVAESSFERPRTVCLECDFSVEFLAGQSSKTRGGGCWNYHNLACRAARWSLVTGERIDEVFARGITHPFVGEWARRDGLGQRTDYLRVLGSTLNNGDCPAFRPRRSERARAKDIEEYIAFAERTAAHPEEVEEELEVIDEVTDDQVEIGVGLDGLPVPVGLRGAKLLRLPGRISAWSDENHPRMQWVSLLDLSLTEDGREKRSLLRVPPDMRNVREAVAWTFGVTAGEYAPIIET